jgi:hypothetical protein
MTGHLTTNADAAQRRLADGMEFIGVRGDPSAITCAATAPAAQMRGD